MQINQCRKTVQEKSMPFRDPRKQLALQEAACRCWELARGSDLQLLHSDLAFSTVGAGRCA